MNRKQQIRENFRKAVFKRDSYKCKLCNKSIRVSKLDAHHITDRTKMPNGGYVKENGITLCQNECHMKAEKFHISNGQEWEEKFHPNDLYSLIGSSYELAVKKSELL